MTDTLDSVVCPRCGVVMDSGYLALPGGNPVLWTDPKAGFRKRKKVAITAWRCPACGHLQLETKPDYR